MSQYFDSSGASVRTSEHVRRYFVAPPDDSDRSTGGGLLFGGLSALLVGWVVSLSVLTSGSETDPYSSSDTLSSTSDSATKVLVGVALWLVGNVAAWYLLKSAIIRLHRYNRQFNAGSGSPSDVDMEAWLQEDIAEILKRGEAALNVPGDDRRSKPLLVFGPALPTDYAVRGDGVPRFASYEAAVVIVSEGFVSVYNCVLNFVTGKIGLESTNEFALGQVSSVGTFNDRLASHGAGPTDGKAIRMEGPIAIGFLSPTDVSVRQEFRIILSSGHAEAVTIGCHVNGENITREKARSRVTQALKPLRSSIREVGRGEVR